jgi:hypothetical protein
VTHWLKALGHARAPLPDAWLENAPPVEAIGVPARSMSQQSHIRLRPEQYALAVEVVGSVAA